ncbi:MAG: T9SS type A sorting domain-containing protein [Bacteroidetes bacterium]|nr:T9SS type A sorting domain-containing protein [Bacteroidota bacterium]
MEVRYFDPLKTGIKEHLNNIALAIYPNPTRENITIEVKNPGTYNVKVYNPIGQKLIEMNNINTPKTNLNVSALPEGIYYVEIRTGEITEIKKILVSK